MSNPIRATIVYALVSGFMVVPLALLLSVYLSWPAAFKLTLWVDLALYGVLMARWSGTGMLPVVFPLAILLGAALWPRTYNGFFILAIGVFSWIRSGICFQGASVRTLMAEVVTMVGGAALLLFFGAYTPAAWALNICLFFLAQSLYFFWVSPACKMPYVRGSKDRFEQAVEEASKILDGI